MQTKAWLPKSIWKTSKYNRAEFEQRDRFSKQSSSKWLIYPCVISYRHQLLCSTYPQAHSYLKVSWNNCKVNWDHFPSPSMKGKYLLHTNHRKLSDVSTYINYYGEAPYFFLIRLFSIPYFKYIFAFHLLWKDIQIACCFYKYNRFNVTYPVDKLSEFTAFFSNTHTQQRHFFQKPKWNQDIYPKEGSTT